MSKIILAISFLFAFNSFAGVNGGGGGVRPGMGMFSQTTHPNVDFVRLVDVEKDNIIFQYKGFDSKAVETHSLNPAEINPQYLKALKRSLENRSWVPVSVDPK